eukprot:m.83204 g.83204  ORF g.83204 m.83204 type:complete len:742 (+) comp12115_c0_seq4:154-2379(+)
MSGKENTLYLCGDEGGEKGFFVTQQQQEMVFLSDLVESEGNLRQFALRHYGRSIHYQQELFLNELSSFLGKELANKDFNDFLERLKEHPLANILVDVWFCVEETLMTTIQELNPLMSKALMTLSHRLKSAHTSIDIMKSFQLYSVVFKNKKEPDQTRRKCGVAVQELCMQRLSVYWWHRLQRIPSIQSIRQHQQHPDTMMVSQAHLKQEHNNVMSSHIQLLPQIHFSSNDVNSNRKVGETPIPSSPSFLPHVSMLQLKPRKQGVLAHQVMKMAHIHKLETQRFLVSFLSSDRRAGWPFLLFVKLNLPKVEGSSATHVLQELVAAHEMLLLKGRIWSGLTVSSSLHNVICKYVHHLTALTGTTSLSHQRKGSFNGSSTIEQEKESQIGDNSNKTNSDSDVVVGDEWHQYGRNNVDALSKNNTIHSSATLLCVQLTPLVEFTRHIHPLILQRTLSAVVPSPTHSDHFPAWRTYTAVVEFFQSGRSKRQLHEVVVREMTLYKRYKTAQRKLSHHTFSAYVNHVEAYLTMQRKADTSFNCASQSDVLIPIDGSSKLCNMVEKHDPHTYIAVVEALDEQAAKFFKFVSASSITEKFRHFLFQQGYGNEDSFLFWMKVQKFRTTQSSALAELALSIFYTYLHPTSGTITSLLKDKVVCEVKQKVDGGVLSRTMFDRCARAVLVHLSSFVKPFKRELERAKKLKLFRTRNAKSQPFSPTRRHRVIKFSLGAGVTVHNIKGDVKDFQIK